MDLDIVYITKTIRKLKAALCAVIGDDSAKIDRAKEIFKDQACVHIHEHDHGEEEKCTHHEANNFFTFFMNYELEENIVVVKDEKKLKHLHSLKQIESERNTPNMAT